MSSQRPAKTGGRSATGLRPLPLRCGVQHYAWGDARFLPDLLGIENPTGEPYAELWMGAHPDLPSTVEVGEEALALDRLIAGAPEHAGALASALAAELYGLDAN